MKYIYKPLRRFWLTSLTGILLVFCFPKMDFSFLIWISLIPWFIALDGKGKNASFGLGYLCGIIFFSGTLFWFVHVHPLAPIGAVIYLSLYFGVFAWFYSSVHKRSFISRLFLLPCFWVFLEFLRDHVLTGFGWVSLSLSQYQNYKIIQIVDVTGVYGVSYLIVVVNVFLKELVVLFFKYKSIESKKEYYRHLRSLEDHKNYISEKTIFLSLFIVVGLFGIAYFYGASQLEVYHDILNRKRKDNSRILKVAVIQGNIDQDLKWYEPAWDDILSEYVSLTQQALKEKPDLIIWPETSIPGIVGEDNRFFSQVSQFVDQHDVPLLLGAVVKKENGYFNTAVLLDDAGVIQSIYSKLHLVPFGEYVPFRRFVPRLAEFIPVEDFTKGTEFVKFLLKNKTSPFSALICFEDTVAPLARKFANEGSQLFINITNDAWFKDTKAPFLHLQASIFQAIENRRFLIRSANTGVSSFINPCGEVYRYLESPSGKKTFVSGFLVERVGFLRGRTFYMIFGDIFVYVCMLYLFIDWLLVAFIINKRKRVFPNLK